MLGNKSSREINCFLSLWTKITRNLRENCVFYPQLNLILTVPCSSLVIETQNLPFYVRKWLPYIFLQYSFEVLCIYF